MRLINYLNNFISVAELGLSFISFTLRLKFRRAVAAFAILAGTVAIIEVVTVPKVLGRVGVTEPKTIHFLISLFAPCVGRVRFAQAIFSLALAQ